MILTNISSLLWWFCGDPCWLPWQLSKLDCSDVRESRNQRWKSQIISVSTHRNCLQEQNLTFSGTAATWAWLSPRWWWWLWQLKQVSASVVTCLSLSTCALSDGDDKLGWNIFAANIFSSNRKSLLPHWDVSVLMQYKMVTPYCWVSSRPW